MYARRVVVQVAEAMLSATSSSAAQRGCRPVVAVIIAVVVVTTIIATPNRESMDHAERKPSEEVERQEKSESSGIMTAQRASNTRAKKRDERGISHDRSWHIDSFICVLGPHVQPSSPELQYHRISMMPAPFTDTTRSRYEGTVLA